MVTESVWDYPRPPSVDTAGGEDVRLVLGGIAVARTDAAIRVCETSHPPTYYLPRTAFAPGVLRPARDGRPTVCEFKGMATYYDLLSGKTRIERAAWSYDDPAPGFEPLLDHIAVTPVSFGPTGAGVDGCFVDGERAQPQVGGFYGGWITARVTGPFKGPAGTLGW